jgi:hypothetical protein
MKRGENGSRAISLRRRPSGWIFDQREPLGIAVLDVHDDPEPHGGDGYQHHQSPHGDTPLLAATPLWGARRSPRYAP